MHGKKSTAKLNLLRASVLGANDGIISLAALVVGVAGATNSSGHIFITGIAGLCAGALSMAIGEYVSVSSQRDTEMALLEKERYELKHFPKEEFQELISLYEKKGLKKETAQIVAKELTAHDVFTAHAEAELGINAKQLANPWYAAIASAIAFTVGAVIPLIAILVPLPLNRVITTFLAVIIALIVTGILSAKASGGDPVHASMRVVFGGLFAMLITFGIGTLLSHSTI